MYRTLLTMCDNDRFIHRDLSILNGIIRKCLKEVTNAIVGRNDGGGTVFGPTPRSYAYKLPKKVRRLAIKSALATKVVENNIVVLEDLVLNAPKTKDMLAVLKGLTVEKKALIVTADANESVELSARNIPGVTVITADGVNVLDVLHHDKLIMTKAAVEKVEEVLA